MINTGYDPYSNGRWYRVFIESNGTAYNITETDLDVTVAGTILKMPENFHVMDVKYDMNTISTGSAQSQTLQIYSASDGHQGINLPKVASFDYGYIYIFGHFN